MSNGQPQQPQFLRALLSIVETGAYIFALVAAAIKGGHFDPASIMALLTGFVAHGANHPAGGSPI